MCQGWVMDHTLFASAFSPNSAPRRSWPQTELITHSSFSSPMTCGTLSSEIHNGFPCLFTSKSLFKRTLVLPQTQVNLSYLIGSLIIWLSAQWYILKEALLVTVANVVLLCLQPHPSANHSQCCYNLHGLGMCLAASNNFLIMEIYPSRASPEEGG